MSRTSAPSKLDVFLSEIDIPADILGENNFAAQHHISVPLIVGHNPQQVLKFYLTLVKRTPAKKDQDHVPMVLWIGPYADPHSHPHNNQSDHHTVGILGGMGPLASAEMIRQYHGVMSGSSTSITLKMTNMLDRTGILLEQDAEKQMQLKQQFEIRSLAATRFLTQMGAASIVAACNTFHGLADEKLLPGLLSIIQATHDWVRQQHIRDILFLGTDGTKKTGIYNNLPAALHYPPANMQQKTMALIYSIKTQSQVTHDHVHDFMHLARQAHASGMRHIGLFCTELPLVANDPRTRQALTEEGLDLNFIDPMFAVSQVLKKRRFD
jgi:hypothetical protein